MTQFSDDIEKKYFSITEVAQLLDVNASLIRFWESEFDIINPTKNKKGERRFTQSDIKDVKMVYHLVKEKGYTLDGAKEYLKNEAEVARERLQTLERLEKIKEFLTKLRDELPDD